MPTWGTVLVQRRTCVVISWSPRYTGICFTELWGCWRYRLRSRLALYSPDGCPWVKLKKLEVMLDSSRCIFFPSYAEFWMHNVEIRFEVFYDNRSDVLHGLKAVFESSRPVWKSEEYTLNGEKTYTVLLHGTQKTTMPKRAIVSKEKTPYPTAVPVACN